MSILEIICVERASEPLYDILDKYGLQAEPGQISEHALVAQTVIRLADEPQWLSAAAYYEDD